MTKTILITLNALLHLSCDFKMNKEVSQNVNAESELWEDQTQLPN